MAAGKGTGKGTRTSSNRKRKTSRKKTRSEALTPRERVRESQEKVLKDMPEIVEKICDAARTGSHTAAKFVFDFAGITELQSPLEETKSEDSLAGILLKKLESGAPGGPPEEDGSGTVE